MMNIYMLPELVVTHELCHPVGIQATLSTIIFIFMSSHLCLDPLQDNKSLYNKNSNDTR